MSANKNGLWWLCEVLFSCYCGLLIAGKENLGEGSKLRTALEAPTIFLDRLRGHRIGDFEPHLLFGAAFVAFLLVLGLLRLIALLKMGHVSCLVVGVLTVLSPLYFPRFDPYGEVLPEVLLWTDLVIALSVIALSLTMICLRRPEGWCVYAAPFAWFVHFVLWSRDALGVRWTEYTWQLGVAIVLPVLTLLTWGAYLRSRPSKYPDRAELISHPAHETHS